LLAILKRLSVAIAVLLLIVLIGTVGFVLLEGLSAFEAFYFTVASITTVGYGDIVAVTTAGRLLAMSLIVTGFTFFTATVITAVQFLFEQREEKRLSQQLHTLTDLYFSEVGGKLLKLFCDSDPVCQRDRESARGKALTPADFAAFAEELKQRTIDIDPHSLDWKKLEKLLDSRLLLNLLESPGVFEHREFNTLVRASFHLKDELAAHPGAPGLSDAILTHLATDTRKVYEPAVKLWLDHMRYMKKAYPSLFYTMLKSNPFVTENPEKSKNQEPPASTTAN
jgi:hypothetical protein